MSFGRTPPPSADSHTDVLIVDLGHPLGVTARAVLDAELADDSIVVFSTKADERLRSSNVASVAALAGDGAVPGDRWAWGSVAPMTDAVKVVDGDVVMSTLDRASLRVVEPPLAVPMGLARRWAATRHADAPDQSGSAVGRDESEHARLAALLSELATVEPELRILPLDVDPSPGASHG